MSDLVLSLLGLGLVLLAWAVWVPVIRALLRATPPRHPRPLVDEPSGPLVPASELVSDVAWQSQVNRRHPEPWWIGDRHHVARRPHRTGVVCDRTTVDLPVDEVRRIAEGVGR